MKIKILLLLAAVAMAGSVCAQDVPLFQGVGRIAVSCDGNEHDDDDWAATPFTLAMIKALGAADHLSLYIYSDHIWGSNIAKPETTKRAAAYDQMHESALKAKEYFSLDKTTFLCAVDDPEAAYNALRDQINLSTASNPLIIIAAGPMQVVGEALNRSNKSALPFVSVVSHSDWNNEHSDKPKLEGYAAEPTHTGWTWKEMNGAFVAVDAEKGVSFVMIPSQNGDTHDDALSCKKSQFDWVLTSPARDNQFYKEGSWDWLYTRLQSCLRFKTDCFDISDSGMTVYVLTGNKTPTPADVQKILENPVQ